MRLRVRFMVQFLALTALTTALCRGTGLQKAAAGPYVPRHCDCHLDLQLGGHSRLHDAGSFTEVRQSPFTVSVNEVQVVR